jgi:hypothetical protein
MPWGNRSSYGFDRLSVLMNAPQQSGLYVIYNSATWVYVGESWNIRARLFHHLNGDEVCITMFPNLTFSYELGPAPMRTWGQEGAETDSIDLVGQP